MAILLTNWMACTPDAKLCGAEAGSDVSGEQILPPVLHLRFDSCGFQVPTPVTLSTRNAWLSAPR